MTRADAARNRRRLVDAARRVFERDGYVAARITDISAAAGVAHGSFYSHFTDKADVLAAVLEDVGEEMLHPGPDPGPASPHDDPAGVVAGIEAANRAYLTAYRRNAGLMAMLEQLSTTDDAFRALRLRRTRAFVTRNARFIRRLQERGLADPDLDPELAATALSAMVSRTAYVMFTTGRPVALDRAVHTLTRLWVNALRIEPGAPPAAR
ncbi:TetR/AcrR family transcriptional regulator [Dactylosporangium sp. NPDC005572]|uniref:TetR/AcrR family transcriptional regulator n=1 Tax=Dactylosporangium sp. NPDC005572 TaxID=3156889 RepID=UPI0033AA3A87